MQHKTMKKLGPRSQGSRLSGFLQLMRPVNCIIAAVAALVAYSISAGGLAWDPRLPAVAAATMLICAGGQSINDYFDRDVDARGEKKSRPIPSGRVTASQGLWFSLALFAIGNATSLLFLPTPAFLIGAAYTALLLIYSSILGRAKYIGNLVVASATGATYIFGAALTGDYLIAGILGLSALLANIGREIAKDLEDQGIDKGAKTTLPMKIGERAARWVSAAGYLISVPFVIGPSLLPTLANTYPQLIPYLSPAAIAILPRFLAPPFLSIIAISCAVMITAANKVLKGDFHKSQQFAKAAMAIALVAYLAALFFPAI